MKYLNFEAKIAIFDLKLYFQRNKYCQSNGCIVTGKNTVFKSGTNGFEVSNGKCIGQNKVSTWECTNVPTSSPWDTTSTRCSNKGNCKAGPFLSNGHFDYNNMQC